MNIFIELEKINNKLDALWNEHGIQDECSFLFTLPTRELSNQHDELKIQRQRLLKLRDFGRKKICVCKECNKIFLSISRKKYCEDCEVPF